MVESQIYIILFKICHYPLFKTGIDTMINFKQNYMATVFL